MDYLSTLQQGVISIVKGCGEKPSAQQLAIALKSVEQASRKTKPIYDSNQLKGTWRLCFITGTKKAQNQAGMVLQSGRYLPRWVTVELTFTPQAKDASEILENCIQLGGLQLQLTGPARFLTPKNILAFDFTNIKLRVGQQTLYSGKIRGGKKREKKFDDENINKQAFFTYFLIEDNLIAARGKG
ncbi:MAG: hypothetical protein AAGF26_06245, partial [Cyanobacteria bacterium P01_G01_bin.49]